MALGIVPNGIKLEFNGVQNGIPVVNRVFITQAGSVGSADLTAVIFEGLTFFNNIKTLMHPSYSLANITATDVSIANGPQTILPLTTSNVGTGSGTAVAANAAVVISLRTNFTGRSFRGRFFAGALVQGSMADAQNISTGAAINYSDHFNSFIDALVVAGKTLVVVSNYASGLVRIVALATEIISVIVDTKIDSQRRRTAN